MTTHQIEVISPPITVAVVMAVHNPIFRHLLDQLRSIFQQAHKIDRLIIVDDASASPACLVQALNASLAFALVAPPIDIYTNEMNLGHTKSFLAGAQKANEDWVFFSDQDDFWLPNKISRCLEFLCLNPHISCLTHDFFPTDDNLVSMPHTAMQQLEMEGLPSSLIGHGFATVIHKSVIPLVILATDERGGHDGWIRTFGDMLDFRMILREPLALWRRHPDSHTDRLMLKYAQRKDSTQKKFSYKLRLRAFRLEMQDLSDVYAWLLSGPMFPVLNNWPMDAKIKIESKMNEIAIRQVILLGKGPHFYLRLQKLRWKTLAADATARLFYEAKIALKALMEH